MSLPFSGSKSKVSLPLASADLLLFGPEDGDVFLRNVVLSPNTAVQSRRPYSSENFLFYFGLCVRGGRMRCEERRLRAEVFS